MEYVKVETHGNVNDASLCFVSSGPEGMLKGDTRMCQGLAARKLMPSPAVIRLRDEYPGIKLAGFIGNLPGYLIFNSIGRSIIEQHCARQKIEYLPFDLINHKGRLHSSDYCIVNPLAGFDALNLEASVIDRSPDGGKILDISRIVLDSTKLASAPPLFRLVQKPIVYVMSQALIEALKTAKVNNIAYRPLLQQASQ